MEEAQRVEKEGNLFMVRTDIATYLGKAMIIATGRKPRELKVPSEAEFKNRGVTYCATCDAPLFQDLDVAVVGGGNSGLEAVLQLTKIAKNINLIEIGPQLKADTVLVEKAKASDKVKIWTNTQVVEVVGDKVVTGIRGEEKREGEVNAGSRRIR